MLAYISHNRNMARRGIPKQVDWFLREWMDMLGVNQAEMIRRTGWSKASASQLYNNIQNYSPKVMNEAAKALNLFTYELLMPPEQAMGYRRLGAEALRIVEGGPTPQLPQAPASSAQSDSRKRKSG